MNIPSYSPNIATTGPYSNPGNQYPITNQAFPPNAANYGPQPVPAYNTLPYQPIQPFSPETNLIPPSNAPLLINQGVNYSLEATECMEDLNLTPEVIITKEFDGFIRKDIKYTVSAKGEVNRVMFIGNKKSEIFFNNNVFDIRVKYAPRDVVIETFSKNKDFEKRLFDVTSSNDLFSGFSVKITNRENGTLFGIIKQPNSCCCSDPDYQLLSGQNLIKYRITTDGCQCSYCCCDGCCCAENETHFRILDSTRTQLVGQIFKNEHRKGDKELLYNVTFPVDATPEDKIRIISTVMSIDCLKYRTINM